MIVISRSVNENYLNKVGSKIGIMKSSKFKDSKILWYSVSTLILAGLIVFADIKEFVKAVSSVDPLLMFASLVSGLSVFLIWGYVWHSFFQNLGFKSSAIKSYKILMAGNFMNSVTPLGQFGGEPFMAYVVSKNTGEGYERSLSTVISADIVNAIPFLTYGSIGILYIMLFSTITMSMRTGIYLLMIINVSLIILAYLTWFKTDKIESIIHNFLDKIESRINYSTKLIDSIKDRIADTKEAFKQAGDDKRHLVKVITVSHLAPLTQLISLYLILLGLDVLPTFAGVYFTVILGGLASFSPTPGGAGTFEAAFSGLLLFFYPEIALDTAVASSVLFRLTTFWPGLLIGYISLLNLKHTK